MQEDDGPAPRFRVLGPFEVVDGGEPLRIRSRLQRLLLTVLLLEAGRTVSADRLVEELWGDDLPDDPAGALRTQVSRLRRVLPGGAPLITEPGGYHLDVDPDDVDVRRFEQLVAAAADHSGDEALRLVEDALALWRGGPLEEFLDRAFAQTERARLDGLQGAAREQRISLLVAVGRVAEAAAAAESLLAVEPEREQARALLMEALYRLGRPTDALAAYQSWCRELGERGLEPSPTLRDVEVRILRHTIDTEISTTIDPVSPGAVPRPVSAFFGRDTDLMGVADLLATARLVTLWGPGGVGKTRLGVEVAAVVGARYRDGVHLCDLTVLTAGSDVARAIATTVGVQERSGRRLEDQLVDRLAGQRVLLIFDNCEHVLDAAASVAQRLIQSTLDIDVLATSRERLGVDGEHLWEVAPLDVDGADSAAAALFVDRARTTSPSFHPSVEDLALIGDVCRRLDGLPLAVELAAARTRGLSPRQLLDALDVRPDMLSGGAGIPRRHRSLRAVIDWSYSLLEPVEQRVFDRLAVFRGTFDLDAARAVIGGDGLDADDVAPTVLRLLDRALIVERTDGPVRRYSMLDTVRRYAIEHLDADHSLDRTRARHARWVVAHAERAALGLAGPDEAVWARAIENDVDELRAAHRWLVGHDVDGSLRLVTALRPYALWRGHSEMLRWAEVAAAAASGTNSPHLPEALLAASIGAWQRGDLDAARAAACAIVGNSVGAHRASLEASADVAFLAGELDRARRGFIDAYELALATGNRLQAVWDIGSAAVAAGYEGDAATADRLAALASATAEQCGSPSARAFAHFVMGEILAPDRPDAAASRTSPPRSPTAIPRSAAGTEPAPGHRCGSPSAPSSPCWYALAPWRTPPCCSAPPSRPALARRPSVPTPPPCGTPPSSSACNSAATPSSDTSSQDTR